MIDEFDPLTGDPLPKTNKLVNGSNSQVTDKGAITHTISETDLSRLEEMSRDELLGLIKCLPARITGYALQTKDERREAMKLRVYEIAMASVIDSVTLKACNDWLDREDGKATQRIEQKNLNVNVTAAREMTTAEIMSRLANAPQSALEASGVKLIGGKLERVVD